MSKNPKFASLVDQAIGQESKYEWNEAASSYKKAVKYAQRNPVLVTELFELIIRCLLKSAFQADSNAQFRSGINHAIENCEKAIAHCQTLKDSQKNARIKHFRATIALANSWIEPKIRQKQTLLEEWWKLEKEAAADFEAIGDLAQMAELYNNLMEYNFHTRLFLFRTPVQLKEMHENIFVISKKAINASLRIDDKYKLARAYCWAGFYHSWAVNQDLALNKQTHHQKGENYIRDALALSEKVGDAYLIGYSSNAASNIAVYSGDLDAAVTLSEAFVEQGKLTRDNIMLAMGSAWLSMCYILAATLLEDPEKERLKFENALRKSQDSLGYSRIIEDCVPIAFASRNEADALIELASIETDLKSKRDLLERAFVVAKESAEFISMIPPSQISQLYHSLSSSLCRLSEFVVGQDEKKRLLAEALYLGGEGIRVWEEASLPSNVQQSFTYGDLGRIHSEQAKVETDPNKRLDSLNNAVEAMETCLSLAKRRMKDSKDLGGKEDWGGPFLRFYYLFAEILKQKYSLTKDKEFLDRALSVYREGLTLSGNRMSSVAELHWQIGRIHDQIGDQIDSAKSYDRASEAYLRAAEKIPQLKEFYENYSNYMRAWSHIESARYNHAVESYEKANMRYEEAARLHEKIETWSFLAPYYHAWAQLESAEVLSRREEQQQAKEAFEKALEQFTLTEMAISQKKEVTAEEEKELMNRLLQASSLRRRFCQARIQIEEARMLDRQGKYLHSSKSYKEAGKQIKSVISEVETEAERKELELISILCQAWEKMAFAEGKSSPEVFLEAADLFEKAKNLGPTEKTSLWALANSNFCKGLAAKIRFQSTLEKSFYAKANTHMKNAASFYMKSGFETASEYARAMQRLFDAYVYMNSAEGEVDPEKKTKFYQLAEHLLQVAAGLFVKSKQPEKTAEVQRILATVREEKALAASLNQVMLAPSLASSTLSFTAPSPTSEASVGLEQFQHANVQANLIVDTKEVKVGESFCLSVEFVNAGKEPALLTRVEDFVPPDFVVVKKPEIYRLEESCLNMKGKQIASLKLVEAKLVLQPSKKGVYQLKPTVHYLDEVGQSKSLNLKSLEIKVEEVVLADRVSTGTKELDSLLLGGIPKEYAVVLTGPPSDERELIIKNFLEAGTEQGQTSFYVATEADDAQNLLEKPGFYLFLCNPKPKVEVPDLPNITKLRSKTDINNLNMALARESRNLQTQQTPKRLCVEIVSDVLLEFGATTARKWVSELLTDLGSKGFTILAVLDPSMHPADHANAIINLFDGEIRIIQSDDPKECKKQIQVRKLRGQDYIKNPICITT